MFENPYENQNNSSNNFSDNPENKNEYSQNPVPDNSNVNTNDNAQASKSSYYPNNASNPINNRQTDNNIYSSYEWNAEASKKSGEEQSYYQQSNNPLPDDGSYRYSGSSIPCNYPDNNQQNYNGVYGTQDGYSQLQYPFNNENSQPEDGTKKKKEKKHKDKKPIGRGTIAAVLAISILCSGVLGFGGGILSSKLSSGSSDGVTINKVVTSVDKTSASTTELSTTEISKLTVDSVVEITTEVVSTGGFSQQYIQSGAGSGVIISENGYIITNNHVIDGASKITVTLRNSKSYDAKLVGRDATLDVALLKIDATGLQPATIGDSSTLSVGDKTVAIGNPLGQLGGTVTDGIISSLSRDVVIDNVTMNLLQTNAAINPGNSGGGLFNGKGELIGIVVAKSSGSEIEGLGFAIPVNHITDVIEDLKKYGYVRGRVDLGMSLLDITSAQMAMMYGVSQTGCYISSVDKNSNASEAGFRSGDRIVSVNSTEVSSAEAVNKVISSLKVGDTVKFTVERNGQKGDLSFVLEEDIPETLNANSSSNSTNNSNNNSFNNNNNSNDSDNNSDSNSSNSSDSIYDYFGW